MYHHRVHHIRIHTVNNHVPVVLVLSYVMLIFPTTVWVYASLSYLHIQGLIYEIITGVHSASTEAASTSSVPPVVSTTKSVDQLLSDFAPVAAVWF